MKLPNLSNLGYVGRLRHIQSAYETPEHRNPDGLIRHFLSGVELWGCELCGTVALRWLRRNPFYYYVLARTRYYDGIFAAAIDAGMKNIINIGAGSDTRAYRYADQLCEAQISCLECDQEAAISAKENLARRKLRTCHVGYASLDLNLPQWGIIEKWFEDRGDRKTLVVMEGVSPYIDEPAFTNFLKSLAGRLAPGSRLAYDFKRKGVSDSFGSIGAVKAPFRLSDDHAEVARFHERLGFQLERLERADDLVARILPGLNHQRRVFSEDVLVEFSIGT